MKANDPLYQQLARIGHAALGSGPRLALLDLLAQAPRTVEALAKEAGLTLANASQHLKVLRHARLVEAEKRGVFVTYRVADGGVGEFFGALRRLGERLRAGEVTLLDVRPAEEYRAAHITGALSVAHGLPVDAGDAA